MFAPHSGYAHAISALSYGVLRMHLGILPLVAGLVTYSTWKFRGEPEPTPTYGPVKLELTYTIGFVLILSALSYFSVQTMFKADPPSEQPANLIIVAHQWWWKVRYPKTGLVTANEIHVMAGQPQRVGFRSADVIHDFWVPQLGRKMDVIPGTENRTWFAADRPGTYYGRCAESCGQEHAWMRIRVIAQPPDDYRQREQAPIAALALSLPMTTQDLRPPVSSSGRRTRTEIVSARARFLSKRQSAT